MPITVVRTRGFKLGGDLDGDGQADPGDIFSHEIIVTNSDAVNRLNLVDTETENGLTIDPASVKIGPIAVNDAFNFSGNTPITFTAAQLLGNDLDPDDATPNLTITNVSSLTGGTVVDNGNGTYTFTPTTGLDVGATATFSYDIVDADGVTSVDGFEGLVTLTVTDVVWYVNNFYAGENGASDGSYLKPFTSLTQLNGLTGDGTTNDDVDAAGETIFIYSNGTAYNAGITLENSQQLRGDQGTFLVNGLTIGASANNSTINHAGTGIVLASGNTVHGFDLVGTATGAAGITDNGATVGTLLVTSTNITGQGQIIDIDNGGTFAAGSSLGTLGSTGSAGANGGVIDLTGVTGTLNVTGATTINGTHGQAGIDISGNTGGLNVTFQGNVTVNTGANNAINVTSNTGTNTVTFSGGAKDVDTTSGTALNLTANTTATTVSFTNGGLDVDSTTGTGLAVGASTLNVSGASNSVTTTTGQIVNAANASVGSGNVTFASLTSGTTTSTAIDVNNLDGGTFTSTTTTIAGSAGDGVNIRGDSSTNFEFGTVTINATGDGIESNASTGLLRVVAGSVTSTGTGDGVNITGGTGVVEFQATVTKSGTGGNVVEVNNHETGTITFFSDADLTATGGGNNGILVTDVNSGHVEFAGDSMAINTGASIGVNLTNNSGSTINFNSGPGGTGLDITTTSGTGFNATGGGTVTVTNNSGNTISSTSGTAINIVNTNIGGGDVTFRSISAGNNTAAADPVNGIVLNNTGTSASFGGLVVTGDGSGAMNGSGGLVTGTTGVGISLTNTRDVSLTQLNVSNTGSHGINASSVTNFTYQDATIINAADGNDEQAINLLNLFGNSLIEDVRLDDIQEDGIQVRQNVDSDGNASTFDVLTFRRLDVEDHQAGFGEAGIEIQADLASRLSVLVDDSDFAINTNAILGVAMSTAATHTGHLMVTVQNSTFDATNSFGMGGVQALGGGSGTATYVVTGNTVTNTHFDGIRINNDDTQTTFATVTNNILIGTGNGGGGIPVNNGEGITMRQDQNGRLVALISGNTITGFNSNGIHLQSQDNTVDTDNSTYELVATVTNNTATINPGGFGAGLLVDVGVGDGVSRNDAFINVSGNHFTGSNSAAFFDFDITLQLNEPPSVGASLRVTQARPTGAVNATELDNANFNAQTSIYEFNPPGPTNTIIFSGGTPPLPLLAVSVPGTPDAPPSDGDSHGTPSPVVESDDNAGTGPQPDLAPTGGDASQPIVVDDGVLSQAELDYLVEAAIQRWIEAGATPEQVAEMRATAISVADMAGLYLGSSDADNILIDSDGAGHGWFLDKTPGDNVEYDGTGTRLTADAGGPAEGRMDLLTVLMHELGHQVGLEDSYNPSDSAELMYGYANIGERRLPQADDLIGADMSHAGHESFVLSPIIIGTLPAGKAVRILFESTVNDFANQVIPGFNNTSTITFTGGGPVTSAPEALVVDSLTLGGTIWNDNGAGGGVAANGIKDGTEAGVSGVTVSLFVDVNDDNVPDTPGTPLVTGVLTNGNGDYSFTNLAPGNYIVRVDQDNFDAGSNVSLFTPGLINSSPGNPDPDNNVDNDDNGSRTLGQPAFSNAITLAYNQEPTPGTGNDTNNTLDFGFFANSAPVLNNLVGDNSTFTEGGTAAILDDSSAPELAATVSDANQVQLNGGTLTVSIITNEDAADDVLGISTAGTVTLSSGTSVGSIVSVGGLAIGTISANGSGGNDLAISLNTNDATLANVSTLIQSLTYANSDTLDPSTLQRTISVTINDGLGGSDSENVTVSVVGVNDEPTLVATGANPTYVEDSAVADLFGSVTASTIEAGQTLTSLTLTVSNVTDGADEILRIDGSDVGLTNGNSVVTATNTLTVNVTVAGNLATVSFSGAALNAAALQTLVDGLGYRNSSQDPTDADRVVTITQLVDSGSNVAPNDNTTSLSLASTVNVDPVNDAPSGTSSSTTINEDATYTFTSAVFGFSDAAEGDGFQAVLFAAAPTGGTLFLDADGAGGADPVALTFPATVTVADIDLGLLTFVPTANLNGTGAASVAFQVVDDGSSTAPNVNTDPSANTLSFNINAINDAPAGTDSTVSVDEDGTLILAVANFGFTDVDAGDALIGVFVNSVTGGKLFVNAVEVTLPAMILPADLGANLVTFEPDPDLNGLGAASISFQVIDDSLEAGDIDLSPNTLTIDVDPVNDQPDVPATLADASATEQTAVTIAGITLSDLDLDARNGGDGDYGGASFVIGQAAPAATDSFNIDATGASFTINGSNLEFGGQVFATFDTSSNILGIAFTSSGTAATTALVNEVLGRIQYTNTSDDPPASVSLVYGVDDGAPDAVQGALGSPLNNLDVGTVDVNISAVNDQPTLIATGNNPTFTEGDSGSDLFDTVTASTVEAGQTFTGMTISVTNVTDGAAEELSIDGSTVTLTSGMFIGTANNGLTINVALVGTEAFLSFSGAALSASQIETLIDDLDYYNGSENPTDANRVVTIIELVDSGSNTSPSDNTTALSITSTVNLNPVNDPPTTGNDTNVVDEDGLIDDASVFGNDNDVDGPPLEIAAVNGVAGNVGTQIALGDGLLTVGSDGLFDFDPDGNYGHLISAATALATGAVNTSTDESFTYDLVGGTGPATVTITINGVDSADDELWGDAGNNIITDTVDVDFFDLSQGGDDSAFGQGGDDLIYFGAEFTPADSVDGGAGFDILALLGDYATTPLVLAATSLVNVEMILAFGGSFDVTSNDGNVASGETLAVDGSNLGALDTLVFDGSAESDGRFILVGGAGDDELTGGDRDDRLFGGAGDNDLDGGAGNGDIVNYALAAGAVIVDLSAGMASDNGFGDTDLLAGFENVVGSDFADNLTGDGAINVLDGGIGADTMTGGNGSDSYVVDNVGDVAVEAAGEGTDIVRSSVSFTLGANVENLDLVGLGNINATGNDDANTLTGNVGNNVLNGGLGADFLRGGFGDDTYVVDNVGDAINEFLGQGSADAVQSSISYTLGLGLENLTLTGVGAIDGTGNIFANILIGNANANILDGKAGADAMNGGLGNDLYIVDNVGDTVTESSALGGVDEVQSLATFTLGSNIETLVLTGANAVNGTGNSLVNSLTGNGAANVLDGKGGADTMTGGLGNDTYVIDNVGDVAIELAGGGTDTIQTSVTATLAAEFENLTLTGTGNVSGTGNGANNLLVGNSGANTLDGLAGADTMAGGGGNDTFIVDNGLDQVIETAGGGTTDTVRSSISYTLAAEVENLILTGVAAINGAGNALANTLTGNDANNVLTGGLGADTLKGGLGDDTYVVDDAGDTVSDLAGQGTDTVLSSVSYTLGGATENLNLTGSDNINATGNIFANLLVGNTGNNTLNGGGGADSMNGGLGNDTYIVDNAGDVVFETSLLGGTDEVQSSVNFTLGGNIENLTLTGASAVNGTGNALANVLTGNGQANILNGLANDDTLNGAAGADHLHGGLGNDSLEGGAGNDGFYFENALIASNVDSVLDFNAVNDTFFLDDAVFTTLAAGTLAAGAFVAGSTALDADDRILYDSATGNIFYDADGSGGGAAVLFATVAPATAITNVDFVVF